MGTDFFADFCGSMVVCQNSKKLTHRPIFYPDGEGAVRMVQMVGA